MIDVLLVLLLIGYAVSGYRNGITMGALSLAGFVVGAVAGMYVVPSFVTGIQDSLRRSLVVLVLVLLAAWLGQILGALVGGRLRAAIEDRQVRAVDQVLGAVAGLASVAVVVWFVGGALRDSDTPAVARAVSSSRVLQAINEVMPPQLSTVADRLKNAISNSDFPKVFSAIGPETIDPVQAPDPALLATPLARRLAQSTVKIAGNASCNRGQEGSGAVVGPERVVTNAHVVAGVTRPTVQVAGAGRQYEARVVLFDPVKDLAVLAVPGLQAPTLPLATADLARSDQGMLAGFPRNGPYTVGAVRVRSVLNASGEDIYGRPGAVREVYSLYAAVQPGNSGGPLVTTSGQLAGVVFAKSLDDANTGYALTITEVRDDIAAGAQATGRVPTGSCTA